MDDKLTKQSNGISTIRQLSSTDSALANNLRLCGQMYGREIMPEEPRLWRSIFGSVPAEKLDWCFGEHLRVSQFFPKPADITALMAEYSKRFGTTSNTYRSPTDEQIAAFEAHKKTPEYKQAQEELAAAWKRIGGTAGSKLKMGAEAIEIQKRKPDPDDY